ncbi:MAG: type II toxin-antitoxin system RelE/ParE family toxin [Cyanobacteria bacterium J06629_19]
MAIKSFKSRALKRLYVKGDVSKVQSKHVPKIKRQLARLNKSKAASDMDLPGYRLHQLKGFDSRWAVSVDENYRLTFDFVDGDAYVLDYEDYH